MSNKLAQNSFEKGLQQDIDPSLQPPATYVDAVNIDIAEIGAKMAATNVRGANLAANVTDATINDNTIHVLGAYRTTADLNRGEGFAPTDGIIMFVKGATPPPPPMAATPDVEPDAGIYSGFVAVTVSNQRAGESIYYTTDGSVPTEASTIFGGIIVVTANTTLRFRAFSPISGVLPSDVTTVSYVIAALTVTISPAAGTYLASRVVTLGTSSIDAVIYYTVDGSTPDDTKTQYTSPFTLTENTTVKAIAIIDGIATSAIAETTYGIQLVEPNVTPANSTTINTQTVTMTNPNAVGDIYYTTNGATPTTSDNLYTVPFAVTATTTVKAAVFNSTNVTSAIVERTYTIQCAEPTISPTDVNVPLGQLFTLSTTTSGASIYYTTDGSTPTSGSTLYTAPFSVSGSTYTIKAITIKTGLLDSTILSQSYSIILSQPAFISATGYSGRSYDYGLNWLSGGHSSSYSVTSILDGATNFQLAADFRTISTNYAQTWSSATNRPAGGSTQWGTNGAPLTSKGGEISVYTALGSPLNQGIWVSTDLFVSANTQVSPAGSTDTNFQANQQTGAISEDGQYIYVFINGTDQIYKSADFGVTFTKVGTSINRTYVKCTNDGGTVYDLRNNKTLHKSTDFGVSFSAVSAAPLTNQLYLSEDGSVIYLSNSTASGGGTVGTWRSYDGGATWTQILSGVFVNAISETGQYVGYIKNTSPRAVITSDDFGDTFTTGATIVSGSLGRLNFGMG